MSYDWPVTPTTAVPRIGTSYLISHGTQTVQGTGSNNRVGDSMLLKRFEGFLTFMAPAAYNTRIRVLMFIYKNPRGSALLTDDFMVNDAGAGVDRPLYPKHILHERVRCIYDKTIELKATGNITADYYYKQIRIKKKLNVVQKFLKNSNTGTFADIENNAVYLVLQGGIDTTATPRSYLFDFQHNLEWEDA